MAHLLLPILALNGGVLLLLPPAAAAGIFKIMPFDIGRHLFAGCGPAHIVCVCQELPC